jgi:hypothetical protein
MLSVSDFERARRRRQYQNEDLSDARGGCGTQWFARSQAKNVKAAIAMRRAVQLSLQEITDSRLSSQTQAYLGSKAYAGQIAKQVSPIARSSNKRNFSGYGVSG